ncbi:MAG: hypothetical protein JWN70_4010 [Planctomycetaceae bacterium]|nr:hypothetical protein [Planctomycetaceae bacterium]
MCAFKPTASGLSPEESRPILFLQAKGILMGVLIDNFASANELLDFCDARDAELKEEITVLIKQDAQNSQEWEITRAEQRKYQGWAFIALRDATLAIYHFRSTLYSLQATAASIPALVKSLPKDAFSQIISSFNQHFPYAVSARHAVAHSADMTFNEDEMQKHSVSALGISYFESNGRAGRILSHTKKEGSSAPEDVSVEVSAESLQKLIEIKRAVDILFLSAANFCVPGR